MSTLKNCGRLAIGCLRRSRNSGGPTMLFLLCAAAAGQDAKAVGMIRASQARHGYPTNI